MKFSIIIPVYNVEKYLEQCLDSVLNQTFTDFEVIFINDGSTDNSLKILNDYKPKSDKISIINQKNGGLSDARNAGIKAAKGDYLFLLDSDDWIAKNALEVLAKNIDNQDFIAFNGRRYFENGTTEKPDEGISEKQITGWKYYNKYALIARKFHFVCTVLRIYRRDFLIKNSLFFTEGIYHEDNLFTPTVCYYAQNVKVIPDCLYVYRIREGSIMQTINKNSVLKKVNDTIFIVNELTEFFADKNHIDKKTVYCQNAMWILHGFYILSSSKLECYIQGQLSLTSKDFRATIPNFDMKYLWSLLEKNKIEIFRKRYELDFQKIRKYWRKIKEHTHLFFSNCLTTKKWHQKTVPRLFQKKDFT